MRETKKKRIRYTVEASEEEAARWQKAVGRFGSVGVFLRQAGNELAEREERLQRRMEAMGDG